MAIIDRDPEVCAEKIEKRKQLLIKLHNENMLELKHPGMIREENKPIDKKCEDPLCKIATKDMSPIEKKQRLVIKFLGVGISILLILTCVLVAILIGKASN